MFLSNRIQPLQLHLQETTKDKENQMAKLEDILLEQEKKLEMLQKRLESSESYVSVLKQELSERNLEVVKLQHDISIAVQTESSSIQRISEECGKNHEAEHRAAATEDSSLQGFSALIAELNEKLKQSETLRENLCKKLEEQMLQFEQERLNWEKQQKNIVTNLTLQLQHAEEQAEKAAAQNKEEKERLNEELRNLKDKLKTEAESSQALKWQHDKDVQSYILKLQTLEMEKEEMHQKLANYRGEALETPCSNLSVKYETFEHELKVDSFKQELEHLKKNLNRVKAKKDHENYEAAQLHGEENELSPEFEELTCLDKYLVPSSGYQMFEQSVSRVDSNDPSRFELDSDFMLEQSLNSTTEGNVNLLSSPMPISDVLAGGVSLGTMLDPESFAVYLSSNMRTPGKLNEFSSECDKNLAQRCTLLMEQLEEKEKQFQKCSETLEEMIGKWKAVTAELCTAKLELERKKSIQLGDYKEHQQIVEELHNEGDESRKQIVDQEQLVKETNKTCGEELCNDGDILKRSLPAKEDLKLLLEQNENLQKRLNDVEQELVRALEMCNTLQTSNTQLIQCQQDTEKARESDQQEFDNKLNLKGMEQQLLQEMIKEKEAEFFEREKRLCEEICTLKEVKAELETRLQEQIDHLNAGFQKSMEISEEDWRQQIDLLKQEHERELSQLCDSHKQELLKTCSDMKTEHELLLEELQHRLEESRLVKTEQAVLQAQSAHHMEMEALRLSLTNMHTAHLELSQTNLHKEKEDALVQLRERLNDKRAQEMAILQGRHQFDMKHLQDQHSQELDLLLSQHSQEMEKLREEQSLNIMQLKAEHCQEMEELQERGSKETLQLQEMYGRELEGLRQQNSQEKEKWEKEREQLEQRHQHDIAQLTETLNSEWSAQDEEALQISAFNIFPQKLRVELEEERKRYEELIRQNVSERSDMQSEIDRVRGEIWNFSENKAQQKALKNELDQQHQSQAISLQEETEKDFDYSIDEDQLLQVNELVSGYREVRSRQEFNLFWSQLDRTRASRQELNELKEQLLARSAQVEEIGRLKQDFEQQRMQMKADHEKELEELRIYFEQKSRESEENYREELEMLHQRLREMNDDDREDMVIQNSAATAMFWWLPARPQPCSGGCQRGHSHVLVAASAATAMFWWPPARPQPCSGGRQRGHSHVLVAASAATAMCWWPPARPQPCAGGRQRGHSHVLVAASAATAMCWWPPARPQPCAGGRQRGHSHVLVAASAATAMFWWPPARPQPCSGGRQRGHSHVLVAASAATAMFWWPPARPQPCSGGRQRGHSHVLVAASAATAMPWKGSSALSLDDVSESERSLLLQQLTEQLEQHKEELTYLRLQSEEKHKQEMDAQHAALTLQYKEEVMNMKMALSDRYISEIEALKRKHSLEMEQLRARLSEEHIREITKLHLQSAQEAARQVETGVGEKEMEENYPVRLCLLPEKQQVLDMKETLEHPQRDHERDTKQLEMLHSGQLEKDTSRSAATWFEVKCIVGWAEAHIPAISAVHVPGLENVLADFLSQDRDQVCQTELLPNTQDAFCSSFNTENCEKDSSLQEGVGKGEHHSGPVQGNNHQDRHKKELAAVREQMASVLEEVNQQLQAVCDHAVMEVQDRFNQECQEKTDKQQSLMRELPKVLVSGEHKQEITDLISELQEDEPQTCVLEQQKNEEELGTHESELQKHRSDLRNKLSELQQKHEQELLARVCELKQKHEEDLNAHLSELQQKHEEELDARVSELQQKHEEELGARVSELQQKHEEELGARVSELQQKHEKELGARVSELQQKHEEELGARVSELQQKHEEELGARVSELQQKHEEELGTRVSELQQKHEEELGARVSELQQRQQELEATLSVLQQKHEEELGTRVSELQQNHEEELSARLSELQQKHEEELGARVSELQQRQQELEATLSVLQQKHEEELGARVSELQQKHKEELGFCVSELQQKHEEELGFRVSELQQKHEEDLGFRVSELQQRQQELESTLSELQQKHEEELGARVSELQQKHEEELGTHVSELQQKHEEELGTRVSELQQKHEEELGARVFELQQRQKELEAILSELQLKHRVQIQQLETTNMSKLDSLESSYLSEIQKIRDEHTQLVADLEMCLAERLQEKEEEIQDRLAKAEMQWNEKHKQELQLEKELIRNELATVHMEKFQAMSKELEDAHMAEKPKSTIEPSTTKEEKSSQNPRVCAACDTKLSPSDTTKLCSECFKKVAGDEIPSQFKYFLTWMRSSMQETFLQVQKSARKRQRMSDPEEGPSKPMEKDESSLMEFESGPSSAEEDLKKRLEQQRCQLEEERSQALDVLREEVQRMEEQNHLAMQELRDLHRAEVKKQCLEQMHKLQEEADKLKEQLQNQEENLKERLDQQRCQLEQEKNLALDALHEEVLRMEEQHQTALQELRDLHKEEVQKQSLEQTQKLREELHNLTEQLQKQEIVMTEMNSQRQDLSEELQEKSAQHLQLQEEMELLKCHSEMLLEQQIIQLKEESDAERKSALDEKEEQFRKEEEKMQASHQMELNHMTEQLQEKSRQVLQLQERVSALTKEMETADSQLEVLMQRRDRENQEGENLVAMLRSDVHNAQQEQRKLQDSCQRLLKLFTEVLKSALSTEDLICKKIGLCLDSSLSQKDVTDGVDALTKPWDMSVFLKCSELSENNEKNRASPDCETMTEHSLMSSDEGCELSEYLCDSVLGSLAVGLENEEKILRMSQRLRTAVERLLEMVTDSTTQLEQTREVQQRFQEEFQCRNQEMAQIVIQNQELLKQLAQETEAKNQLQVELHKAQGLIEGYAAEKASMEEELSGKESTEHQLVVELEKSREQLKVLTQEPSVFGEEREVLLRLQEVLSGSVRDVEVELLKETERLAREKLELHCQAKKDRSNLLSQMKVLEMELEEQMSRNQELLKRTNEMTDLQQQIQSLEKQLKNQRHFMDEQAVEREHERDEFQQEIQKLEDQLKQALKNQVDSRTHGLHDWSVQIETLEAQVKEKADDCNLLLQGRNHLEHQIAERNDEIDKMMLRIQELEQATLSNAEAAKKCVQLEEELQKMCRAEKELLQDKEALQQQQYNNVLQISSLQSKLDEARHRVPAVGESDHTLKEQLQAEREALVRKEKEAESLAEQLEQFREDLMNKTEEVLQLNMQLEIQRKQSELAVQQVQEEYLQIKEEMSSLQLQKDQHKNNPSVELPQALLQEKNQEIDHLNEQLLRLQQEMERRKAAASPCSEVEELRSMVELLQSDQQRLRSDKLEEIEQLHEVIEKLQQELEQLTPNRHEVSDSQESLDQLGLGGVENLKNELRMGARHPQEECVTELDKAREDLQHFKVEVMTLQQQLEERKTFYDAEVEVLERNLLNLQESSRQQVQELNSLKGQHSTLQEENGLLRTRLSQKEAEVAILTSQLQDAQDSLRECEASLTEKQLLVQTLQEQRTADVCELENQLAQKRTSLEVASTELKELRSCNDILQGLIEKSSKEHSEREEKYKEEILELMEHVRQWEDKAQSLTTELQNRESQGAVKDQLGIEPETEHFVIVLKEQLSTTENLLREREAELHSTQTLLASMKRELSEMHTECERRGAKVEQVLQQLKKRDVCVAELQSHSQNLGAHVQRLQETLGCQGMLTSMSEELQKQSQDDKLSKPSDQRASLKHTSFSESLTDMSAWDSPDMVRKQEENVYSGRVYTPFSELSIEYSTDLDHLPSKSSDQRTQPAQYDLIQSSTPSLSGSNYSLTHSGTHRTSPVEDIEHTIMETVSSEDQKPSIDRKMSCEQSELDYSAELSDTLKSMLGREELLLHTRQNVDYMNSRGLSANLQNMLGMVHEESCKILALSERPVTQRSLPEGDPLVFQTDAWQKEKKNLQDAIQSLIIALTHAAGKKEKDSPDVGTDWRRELLQSVHDLLGSEAEFLLLELHTLLSHHGSGDSGSLSEKMEHVIKQQEEQKRLVLEHLLASDRSSLLSEIQDLRSQLRMAHLQNQEKLQQLQEILTSTEEKGSTREHQLRRQVELLEYKLQQEASIAEDLKASLSHEKERASEQYQLLLAEQGLISQLRMELEERRSEQEKLMKSQKEFEMEISRLRDELVSKEQAVSVCMQTLQMQQDQENQKMEEKKVLLQKNQDRYEKSLQDLSVSLEELRVQNNKLSAALQHEQTCSSNLRKELQIEQSRCEALLAQERSKLTDTEQELEKVRQNLQSLSSTLTLERNMMEKLKNQHTQELSVKEQERLEKCNQVLTLRSQLEEERSRSRDWAVMTEKVQEQAVYAKRQLESEVQASQEEIRKEREATIKLRAMLESLQSQQQQMNSTLDKQRERESLLQKERDQYQARLLIYQEKERSFVKEIEKEKKRAQETEAKRVVGEEREKRILDLQLQHERDQRRIQELQHMLADLEEQERALFSRKSWLQNNLSSPFKNTLELRSLTEHTSRLEKVWQQLFHAVLQVQEWLKNSSDRILPGCPGEEAITSLLDTLSELKSELQRSNVQPPAESSFSSVDALRSENVELSKSVTVLKQEKLELRSQLAKLETLHQALQREMAVNKVHSADAVHTALEAERAAWHREKRQLQSALKHAESELCKMTSENRPVPDVSNSKMQRLYKRYLRAESFRKALVYQKKYLLLLLGGFQACEKATLSLIAQMGVYPSPADLQVSAPCQPGLTKFRSAVRAVIAISRLKFLVRKWHKISRKGGTEEPLTQSSGLLKQGPLNRIDILHQQQLGSPLLNSPPTRDVPLCFRPSPVTTEIYSPKTSYWKHSRLGHSPIFTPEQSPCTSQDPEHSITEYIRHLELVQQRLGGLQNGSSPELSHVTYIRK
ncbi:pericentrin [Rhinophrynus dorsalis]